MTQPKQHTAGGIREMIAIALPMMISNASETIMTVTDRYFLSQLSPEHMAAAMGGGVLAFTMMCFFIGILGYSTAMVAQNVGANKSELCFKVTFQAIIITFLAYPLLIFIAPLGILIFKSSGISPVQLTQQSIYFNILMYGSVIALIRIALSNFFSGLGKTKIIMLSSFITMMVNVLVNYILIFGHLGFKPMGIKGAAYGTLIGSATGMSILIIAILRSKYAKDYPIANALNFDKKIIKKLLKFGYPAGIELFLNLLGFSTMVLLLHGHSRVTATAATIMFNWQMLAFVPLFGVEISVISLVGRYVGAKQYDIAHKSTLSGLKMIISYSTFVAICLAVFPVQLAEVFHPNHNEELFIQSLPMAISFLRIVSLFIFCQSIIFVFTGALRGAGDTFWPMVISVSAHWSATLGLYIFLKYDNISPPLAWGLLEIIFFLVGSLNILRYKKGKWKQINIAVD